MQMCLMCLEFWFLKEFMLVNINQKHGQCTKFAPSTPNIIILNFILKTPKQLAQDPTPDAKDTL